MLTAAFTQHVGVIALQMVRKRTSAAGTKGYCESSDCPFLSFIMLQHKLRDLVIYMALMLEANV